MTIGNINSDRAEVDRAWRLLRANAFVNNQLQLAAKLERAGKHDQALVAAPEQFVFECGYGVCR